MMDPKAIGPLSRLTKGNKALFTIAEDDGTILKEDDIKKRFPELN